MFTQLAGMFGRMGGGLTTGSIAPPTQEQITGLIGPPPMRIDPTQNHILSDIYSPPYRGPGELDNYGGETPEMRRKYRSEHRTSPVFRSAIDGMSDDISGLKVTVLSADKNSVVCNDAAKFLDWTVSRAPGGWGGLIETMYRAAKLDGWSIAEKRLRPTKWRGQHAWGLAHVRGLDTIHMRLQLDVYRNVVGIVNVLRGLEYYDPSLVLLYTHRGMFGNVFGQSDGRAAIKGAQMIENVYRVWFVAMEVYGLPYMVGKVKDKNLRKQMEATLKALRQGGWVVLTDKEDEINTVDMAASAAVNGFEPLVRTQREDIFFAVRHASLPFMEGKGTSGAHGDTEVEQGTSDAGEKRDADRIADVLNHQLVPWILEPNRHLFPLDESQYPTIRFGGTNWGQVEKVVNILLKAQEAGIEPSYEWALEATNIPAARDESDKLTTAAERQERQQAAQQQQQAGGGGLAAMLGGGQQQEPKQLPAAQPEPKQAAFSDSVRLIPTARLSADPARFQFRAGHDGDSGTVRPLPEAKFDPAKAPPLLAWHDPADDEDYVVDGHHRLAWAERDGVRRVPVRFLDAKSAEEAKEIGRRANVSQPKASTFSADHQPDAAPTAEQVSRAAERFFAELGA